MTDQYERRDPRSQHDSERPEQSVEHPGETEQLSPAPDHGERTYRGSGRLQGTRALVTGGDSGIGRAVAVAFAREGADVAITHLPEEKDDAAEVVSLIAESGRKGVAISVDLAEEAGCTEAVERTVRELGGLDVLVSNHGYQMAQPGGLADITTEQLDRVIKTNLYAQFWLAKAALSHLEPGAAIITTSSIEAYDPAPSLLDYAATKGAIVNFTKGLSRQLAERGIRVNSVAPGPIWTPLIPATMPEDHVAEFGQDTPLGRAGQPAEVAPAFVFLASQESSYITGEVIGVTGGRLLP